MKTHMISGSRDVAVCGAAKGNKTAVLDKVSCERCSKLIEGMVSHAAHLIALEAISLVQDGRFEAKHGDADKLIRQWLLIAHQKARKEADHHLELAEDRWEYAGKLRDQIAEYV